MYLTIHALHVGLIPALDHYEQITEKQSSEFRRIIPADRILAISPFPSTMIQEHSFEEFVMEICEREEIEQNKKVAHQLIIEQNGISYHNNQMRQALNKPLQSTTFHYRTITSGFYNESVHRLRQSFQNMPHDQLRETLNRINGAKIVCEQMRGFESIVVFSDLLERATKFYDFVAWMFLRQFGEISGYGLEKDQQFEDDIGYWDYNQFIQQNQLRENDDSKEKEKEKEGFRSSSLISSPSNSNSLLRNTSSSLSSRDTSSSSSTVISPFLLKHPLVAIQPLFILEDMTNLMHNLLLHRKTINLLQYAKNILHLMSFFVLNFRMISHQHTVIEIGIMLSNILAPQVDREDDEQDKLDLYSDSYTLEDKNIFGMPEQWNDDSVQWSVTQQFRQQQTQNPRFRIAQQTAIKKKKDENEFEIERNQHKKQICYYLLQHPPLFYLFPRALLTFFVNIEQAHSDDTSEMSRLQTRLMLVFSLKMMLNDARLCPILVQLLWEGGDEIQKVNIQKENDDDNQQQQQFSQLLQSSSYSSSNSNTQQIKERNDFNGVINYLFIISRVVNDIRWCFEHLTSKLADIKQNEEILENLKNEKGTQAYYQVTSSPEYINETNERTGLCKVFTVTMNDFFQVLIELLRVGPVAQIESNSFAPIIMTLNYIAATLTDKKSRNLKVFNPRSVKWNPLHVVGQVFDSVIALANPPQTLQDAINESRKYIDELLRTESPMPTKITGQNNSNILNQDKEIHSNFIDATHNDTAEFSQQAFNRIGLIIEYRRYRTFHRIALYRFILDTIKQQKENQKSSDFDLWLDQDVEIPQQLKDPIYLTLIRDAVKVPQGEQFMNFDRKSIITHIIQVGNNPITREPLTLDMIEP
ncbi:MAG: hypothetical protein EZS28_012433, partial [Streblomastix strix]